MHVKQKVNIHNRFDIHIDNIETGEHREIEAFNIILNGMYTALCNNFSNKYFSSILFGTGTGTPTQERTSLFNQLGSKTGVLEEIIKAFPVSSIKKKIVLAPEEYVGQTITEVGIRSAGGYLCTHALLKDSEGNPISITKTGTDVVTIYATVFSTFIVNPGMSLYEATNNHLVNFLAADSVFSVSGIYTFLQEEKMSPVFGARYAPITGDSANKKMNVAIPRFGINDANGHLTRLGSQIFGIRITDIPGFTGQSINDVTIGTGDGSKNKFLIPSRNVNKTSVTIKKDGVAELNVTIRDYSNKLISYPSSGIPAGEKGVAIFNGGSSYIASSGNFTIRRDIENGELITSTDFPVSEGRRGWAGAYDGNVVLKHDIDLYDTYEKVEGVWVTRPKPAYGASPGYLNGSRLNGDGSVLVLASQKSPFIGVFDWDGVQYNARPALPQMPTAWVRDAYLSEDGDTVFYISDAAPYVAGFKFNGSTWAQITISGTKPTTPRGVSLSPDGTKLVCTNDLGSPKVFVYEKVGEVYELMAVQPSVTERTLDAKFINNEVVIFAHPEIPFSTIYSYTPGEWRQWTVGDTPNSTPYAFGSMAGDTLVIAGMSSAEHYVGYYGSKYAEVIFDNAPEVGAAITASYTVDGVHKTDQFVIDASFSIQFGEGV